MLPGGTFVMLLALICYYWADKFVLLHRSSLVQEVSGELSSYTMKLADLTLILRPAGELIFDSQIRMSGVEWCSIMTVCIGGIYVALPMDSIL